MVDMEMLLFLLDEGPEQLMGIVGAAVEELAYPMHDAEELIPEARIVKKNDYFECTIPKYSIEEFKDHFQMTRGAFEKLLFHNFHELVYVLSDSIMRNCAVNIPLEKKVLFTIWVISKQESFQAVGKRFGLSKGNGHFIFKEIVQALGQLASTYIQWPNHTEQKVTANVFKSRSNGFPNVIGAVDVCHIRCRQPSENPHDFYNRKGGFHSIILQGVCDHQKKFINIFVGMPGKLQDARVFRNSAIYQRIKYDSELELFNPDCHLVGDSSYPLLPELMVPYKNTSNLTPLQVKYNNQLEIVQLTIESTFELVKNKFHRLKYLDICDLQLGNNIIVAACVLHNFIIYNDEDIVEESNDMNVSDDNQFLDTELDQPNTDAEIKRNRIAEML